MTNNGYKLTLIEGARDQKFWVNMGPFFASREVAKELSEPMYDREDLVWILAWKRKKIVGFTSFYVRKDGIAVSGWSYVSPELRQKGIWTQMHERKLKILADREIAQFRVATRREDMKKALKRRGFKPRRERGSWVFYEGKVG